MKFIGPTALGGTGGCVHAVQRALAVRAVRLAERKHGKKTRNFDTFRIFALGGRVWAKWPQPRARIALKLKRRAPGEAFGSRGAKSACQMQVPFYVSYK